MSTVENRPNILFIVTDQEYAHQVLPDGVNLTNRNRLHNSGGDIQQPTGYYNGVHTFPLGDVDRSAHAVHQDV